MTRISRRNFGLAALATPVALGTSTAAVAQSAAPVGNPASIYGITIGEYRVTALLDGILPLNTGTFPSGDPEAVQAALASSGLIGESLPSPLNAYLLQSEKTTILVDAGLGALDMMGPGFGQISAGLAALGVSPADIDILVMTHAHPDHIGGMIGESGATYPNAQLIATNIEHQFWTDAGIMAQAPDDAKGIFQLAQGVFGAYADRLTLVENGAEIAAGVTIEIAPGHTMGHAVLHIDGGDRQLMMLSDTVANIDLQTALPNQGIIFDVDAALAAQSRIQLFDRVAADNVIIAGCHIHFPSFGRIVHSGNAYRYVPTSLLG